MLESWEPLGWAGGLGACHRLHLALRFREEATRTLAERGQGLAGRSWCSPLRQLGHRGPDPRAPSGVPHSLPLPFTGGDAPQGSSTGGRQPEGAQAQGLQRGAGAGAGAGEPARVCRRRRDSGRHAEQSAGRAGASPRVAAWGSSPRLPRRTGAFLLEWSPGPELPHGATVTATLASRAA